MRLDGCFIPLDASDVAHRHTGERIIVLNSSPEHSTIVVCSGLGVDTSEALEVALLQAVCMGIISLLAVNPLLLLIQHRGRVTLRAGKAEVGHFVVLLRRGTRQFNFTGDSMCRIRVMDGCRLCNCKHFVPNQWRRTLCQTCYHGFSAHSVGLVLTPTSVSAPSATLSTLSSAICSVVRPPLQD